MEPIISPLIFYFISVLGNLGVASITIIIAAGGALFATSLWGFIDGDFSPGLAKTIKILSIVLIVFLVAYILTPSQETCYQMLVASVVTPDNLEMIKDTGISIGDYIIENAKDIILTIQGGN